MNCNQIRELLPDLAAGMNAATTEPEVEKHIASCNDCATHLRDFQKTMALLDEWQAPEPSPYFDTRLQARLREEMARPHAATWLSWLYRPAWGMSLAAVLFAGALAIGVGSKSMFSPTEAISTKPPSLTLPVQPGTAVGDLQALERNDDLYADFDVLDQLQVQDDVTANP
ncbi:MAG TPA: zf-HC2 domain-containing protein [Terriglobales bacterium]|jgi:anti-sigma factor RsiW|nr:zf-HC2 domain-containing protein [Terriglobales bacterium]